MRKVISILAITILSMQAFAAEIKAKPQEQRYSGNIKSFLIHQLSPKTKILASFINTANKELVGESSTYDQALAGLGFLELTDYEFAKGVLSFFKEKWDGEGLHNFYNTETGLNGIEDTIHLGPNMWMAMFALQYEKITGDKSFNGFAKDIALWAAKLNHKNGGIAMGPVADWGGNWRDVYSSENNIVAYAVFKALKEKEEDVNARSVYEKEMQGIVNFINTVTLKKTDMGKLVNVSVGYNPDEGISKVSSSDVVTMMLLVFNPDELNKFFSIGEEDLLKFAKDNFYVCEDEICGFDFTTKASADLAKRPRMISLEWSAQMADAEIALSQFYERKTGAGEKAKNYLKESAKLLSDIDKKAIYQGDMNFFPYATKTSVQPFPFAPWWKTPEGDTKTCGALSPTLWRFFAYKKFNPLQLR
ncbi:MAG: hypothetical protein PHP17_07165 [Candidatus Omnitrophica bacterium]|nr:hypothetical protein [Candidatus Omnitrophota bacterium]